MKKQLILGSFLALTAIAQAQNSNPWPTAAGTNVGIGTSSPASRLEVLNTANQLRLSYSAAVFSDMQTNSSGCLYVNPIGGRIGFGTNSPAAGFHSNLGVVRLSDAASATRALQISPNYIGSGNIPAGVLVSSALTTAGEGVSYIPTGSGAAGIKLGAYAFAVSAWQPVWETQNVSSGSPSLLLLRNGGNVGIGVVSPIKLLDMSSAVANDGIRIVQTGSGHSTFRLDNSTSGGHNYGFCSSGAGSSEGAGHFILYDYSATQYRMFVHSNGNIGIGTATPAQKLDVAGNINTNGIVTIGSNFILNSIGTFKNNAWAGTGNRLLLTNASGDVSTLGQGTAAQVLYGTGNWGSLPASIFTENGNDISLAAGKKLGLGTSTPVAVLDVNGDAVVRGVLNVSQGIALDNSASTTIKVIQSTNPGAIPIISFSGRAVGGAVSTQPPTDFGDESGPLSCLNNPTGAWAGFTTLAGGNNTALFSSSDGPSPTNPPNFAFLTAFVNKTNAHGYIDLGGSFNGTSSNNALFINSKCNRNVMVFAASQFPTISSNVMSVEGYLNLAKNLQIGVTGATAFTDMNSQVYINSLNKVYGINLMHGGASSGESGIKIRELDDAERAFSIYKGTQAADVAERFSVLGNGKTEISSSNADALIIKDANNSNVVSFNVKSNSQTFIGNVTQTNNSMLTIGQANKNNPAFVLTDNTTNTNKDFFTVQGNGYTEIKVYSPTSMPSNRVFAIKDIANSKDIFVVKSDGKTYAREVEISLATSFPDYVFNKDYKLKSINEVADFIQANKHLPGFEKGEYYEKNGINVNDMLVKQQEKMEEMMLYIIELEKRLKAVEINK